MTYSISEYQQDEKLMEMTNLLKETSHEINNSLTTVLGFTQVVMHSEKLDSTLKEYMDTIYESALDAKNVIDRANSLYEPKKKKLKCKTFINEIVESAIKMASIKSRDTSNLNGIDIKFIKKLESKVNICVNPREIREVLLNILFNAIDSLEKCGEITIETKDNNGGLMLSISDNGKGMDKETVEKLFDPYFTTKGSKGTGLGLSISKKIIESHDGTIEVESEEGTGTTFKIYF